MPSSYTQFTVAGNSLAGLTLYPTAAALAFVIMEGDKAADLKRVADAYLNGPGRKTVETSRLKSFELPANLPPGEYLLRVRKMNDKESLEVAFTVVASPGTKPPSGPVEKTPSHLVKGFVSDILLAATQPIVMLDGSTITFKQYNERCGHKAARLWLSMTPGKLPTAAWVNERVTWAKSVGLSTLVICVPPANGGAVIPTPTQTKAFFETLKKLFTGCGMTIKFELGNEPNKSEYWKPLDLALLLASFVIPAEDVLRGYFEVLSPSPTGSVQTIRDLIAKGLEVDGYAFHPYRNTAAALESMMNELVGVAKKKPIDLTEWNGFPLGKNVRAWLVQQSNPKAKTNDALQAIDERAELPAVSPQDAAANLAGQWDILRDCPTVRTVFYYALIVDKETSASKAALLARDGDTIRETVFSGEFWAKAT
ncbi:MAG: hypothetical protein QM754_00630 [Tepidisphaeraceae bacterium]